LAGARNTGILNSTGEYIAFLDADDIWMPNKLKMESELLDTHPEIGAVYSDWEFFGSKKENHTIGSAEYPFERGWVLIKFYLKCPISYSSVMIRRDCFEKVGLFDESLKQCEDVDMTLRLARYYPIDYILKPLSGYRYHEKNMHLEIPENCIEFSKVLLKCLKDNKRELSKSDYRRMKAYYNRSILAISIAYMRAGDTENSKKYLRRYWILNPENPMTYVVWFLSFKSMEKLKNWILSSKTPMAYVLWLIRPHKPIDYLASFVQIRPTRPIVELLSWIRKKLGLKQISFSKNDRYIPWILEFHRPMEYVGAFLQIKPMRIIVKKLSDFRKKLGLKRIDLSVIKNDYRK
jgi:glycosyltransferase involved in cell wall biosynthesis